MNFVKIGNRILNLDLVTNGKFEPEKKIMILRCLDGKKIKLEGDDAQCLIDLIETPVIAADIKSDSFRHYFLNTHPEGQTKEEWEKTLEDNKHIPNGTKEALIEAQDQEQEQEAMASA